MSELRTKNALKLRAHMILDQVKAGICYDQKAVDWALAILGEPVNG